ncbi:hypothetical protein ACU64V_03210 [Lysinibacillus capsici]
MKQMWLIKASVSTEPKLLIEEIKAEHVMEASRKFMGKLTVNQVCNMVYLEINKA